MDKVLGIFRTSRGGGIGKGDSEGATGKEEGKPRVMTFAHPEKKVLQCEVLQCEGSGVVRIKMASLDLMSSSCAGLIL